MDNETIKYIEQARSIFSVEKNNIEETLSALRKDGANIFHTMRALIIGLQFTVKEADDIILNSDTWSDQKKDNIDLKNYFLDNL